MDLEYDVVDDGTRAPPTQTMDENSLVWGVDTVPLPPVSAGTESADSVALYDSRGRWLVLDVGSAEAARRLRCAGGPCAPRLHAMRLLPFYAATSDIIFSHGGGAFVDEDLSSKHNALFSLSLASGAGFLGRGLSGAAVAVAAESQAVALEAVADIDMEETSSAWVVLRAPALSSALLACESSPAGRVELCAAAPAADTAWGVVLKPHAGVLLAAWLCARGGRVCFWTGPDMGWLRACEPPGMILKGDAGQVNSTTTLGGWEVWTVRPASRAGFVTLESCHGRFLAAEADNRAVADRRAAPPGGWEEWRLVDAGGGCITLISEAHGAPRTLAAPADSRSFARAREAVPDGSEGVGGGRFLAFDADAAKALYGGAQPAGDLPPKNVLLRDHSSALARVPQLTFFL